LSTQQNPVRHVGLSGALASRPHEQPSLVPTHVIASHVHVRPSAGQPAGAQHSVLGYALVSQMTSLVGAACVHVHLAPTPVAG
jgi:hypothetical protein